MHSRKPPIATLVVLLALTQCRQASPTRSAATSTGGRTASVVETETEDKRGVPKRIEELSDELVPASCRDACVRDGRCSDSESGCDIATSEDCAWSPSCALDGLCTIDRGRCTAVTDQDCVRSRACVVLGQCRADSGRCTGPPPTHLSERAATLSASPKPFRWTYDGRYPLDDSSRYLALCQTGDGDACFSAGAYFRQRWEHPEARQLSEMHLLKGCALGHAKSCSWAGNVNESGVRAEPDFVAAATYYRQGCRLGDRKGCGALGYLFMYGLGVAKDDQYALLYLARACADGIEESCLNLGSIFEFGNGVPKDELRAGQLYFAACAAGQPVGCNNLGYALWKGSFGFQPNIPKAKELLESSCEAKSGMACLNMGSLIKAERDDRREQVVAYYERACSLGSRYCTGLAHAYHDGYGVQRDLSRAIEYAVRLCMTRKGDWCTTEQQWRNEAGQSQPNQGSRDGEKI